MKRLVARLSTGIIGILRMKNSKEHAAQNLC